MQANINDDKKAAGLIAGVVVAAVIIIAIIIAILGFIIFYLIWKKNMTPSFQGYSIAEDPLRNKHYVSFIKEIIILILL